MGLARCVGQALAVALAPFALYCGSSDEQAPAPGRTIDAGADSDASHIADAAPPREASIREDASPPVDAPPTDAPPRFDASRVDAEGGLVVSDEDTPCRNLDTEAKHVDFAPLGNRLLATSELGATLISPGDWAVERTYAAHQGIIKGAALSADGTRGASVGNDDELRLWEASTGTTVARLPLREPVRVEFADGGTVVVVVDADGVHAFAWDGPLRLWSRSRASDAGAVSDFLASSAAATKVLTGAVGGGLDLLNAADGSFVAHLDGERGAFSPNGRMLVTATGTTLRVADAVQPGLGVSNVTTSLTQVYGVALGPNGEWVAAAGRVGSDDVVHVIAVPGGQLLRTLDTWRANALSVSPDGRYLATSGYELKVFDLTDGNVAHVNDLTGMFVHYLSLSPVQPYVAYNGVDYSPEIWDYVAGRRIQVVPQPANGYPGTVAFAPSGELLVNRDDTASYWAPGATAPTRSFTYQSGGFLPDDRGNVVISPRGAVIAGHGPYTAPGNLRLWSAADGALIREAPAHPIIIDALAWSPDGALIATAGPDDGTVDADAISASVVKLWNATTGDLVRQLTGHSNEVPAVVFSPDGTLLASADYDGRVRLWSISDGRLVRELTHPPPVNPQDSFNASLAFSPDGRWLAARGTHFIETGHMSYIAIFRVIDGVIVRELRGFGEGNMSRIVWTPDGRYLMGATRTEIRMWCMDATGSSDAGGD